MLPSLHHMQRCLYATSNPSLLLFDTSRWSTISYRVMGYISHVMLVSSMYFTPQLLFQHEWAPFSLRAVCIFYVMKRSKREFSLHDQTWSNTKQNSPKLISPTSFWNILCSSPHFFYTIKIPCIIYVKLTPITQYSSLLECW